MADIYIRKMDDEIKTRLTRLARENGVSLNKYICSILGDYVLHPELRSTEDRYIALAENMVMLYKHLLEKNNSILLENTSVLDTVITLLDEKKLLADRE